MKRRFRGFRLHGAWWLLLLGPWILGATECNTFSGSANKSSDDALMYAAGVQLNSKDYQGALTTIAGISATTRNGHDGRILEASAHAGLCGLNLVSMASDVAAKISSKQLMLILMADMKAATSYADCTTAETLLLNLDSTTVTPNDDIFLAFVEFAKIGAALQEYAGDPANAGSPVASYDSCTVANMPDVTVGDIGAGLNIAISAIKSSGVSLASSLVSEMNTLCGAPVNYPCSITDGTKFTTMQKYVIRTLIKANEIGLATCGGSSGSSAQCTCP